MNHKLKDKLRRAALIHLELLELDKVYGVPAPSPFANHRSNLRVIKDGPWRARIIENGFLTNASLAKGRYGEAMCARDGSCANNSITFKTKFSRRLGAIPCAFA